VKALIYPAAQQVPGSPTKAQRRRDDTRGLMYHSAEGAWGNMLAIPQAPLSVNERSWHLSFGKSGAVAQHYALDLRCGHSSSANDWTIGCEFEGVAGEPLTDEQVQAGAAFMRWLVEEHWLPDLSRGQPGKTLWEHREVFATACPSGRIPWPALMLLAENTPTRPEEDEVDEHARALIAAVNDRLSGFAAESRAAAAANAAADAGRNQLIMWLAGQLTTLDEEELARRVAAIEADQDRVNARLDAAAAALAG